MNNQFWSKNAQRHSNPTLKSRNIGSLLQQNLNVRTKEQSVRIKVYDRDPTMLPRSSSMILSSQLHGNFPEKITSPSSLYKMKSSKMSGIGRSSLQNLKELNNDKQVFDKQHKGREYDIISQKPHDYKDSIKVFPKMRFENFDNAYWRRQAFITGKPSDAYIFYQGEPDKNLKVNSIRNNVMSEIAKINVNQ